MSSFTDGPKGPAAAQQQSPELPAEPAVRQEIGQAVPMGDLKAAVKREFQDFDLSELEKLKALKDSKIAGIDDKAGFKIVNKARLSAKNLRLAFEKKHAAVSGRVKLLAAEVKGFADGVYAQIAAIEDPLKLEEDAFNNAVKAETARLTKLAAERGAALAAVEYSGEEDLASMTEEAFQTLLEDATTAYNTALQIAQQNREAQERADAEKETERLRLLQENEDLKRQLAEKQTGQRDHITEVMLSAQEPRAPETEATQDPLPQSDLLSQFDSPVVAASEGFEGADVALETSDNERFPRDERAVIDEIVAVVEHAGVEPEPFVYQDRLGAEWLALVEFFDGIGIGIRTTGQVLLQKVEFIDKSILILQSYKEALLREEKAAEAEDDLGF